MTWSDIPQTVVAATVTMYWICVFSMVVRSWARFRVTSGSLPKTALEKRMWILWVPTIAAWIALAWNSSNLVTSALQSESYLVYQCWSVLTWVAAVSTVTAFVLTTRCWLSMGSNWTMAVRPDKETRLITDGPFATVRHPIYSLSLLLMISTLIAVTNWWMLLVAVIHCSMLVLKSWNEEQYLTRTHGQQYLEYLKQTNRFVPVRALMKFCLPKSGSTSA